MKPIVRLIVYGIAQYILLMLALFVLSLAFGSDEAPPPPAGFIILAAFMVLISFLFARLLKPTSRKQAVTAGLIWTAMTIVIIVVTAVGNGTQGVFFGNWGVYLMFAGLAVGPLLLKVKKLDVGSAGGG